MLSAAQVDEFSRRGCLWLRGAIGRNQVRSMADFIWDRLGELHGIDRGDPATWTCPAPWAGLNRFKRDPVFAPIASPALVEAIDTLLGAGCWRLPHYWGGFLVKFPDSGGEPWRLAAGEQWHVDSDFTYEPRPLFAVRVFTLFSPLEPRGGATLAVAGSHRLVERWVERLTPAERESPFPAMRDRFNASDPWLARLTGEDDPDPGGRVSYFLGCDREIDGAPVSVEEMCGAPGDIFLMHPWLLHAASRNVSGRPRFQLGRYVFRRS